MMEEKRISPDYNKKSIVSVAAKAESADKAVMKSQTASNKKKSVKPAAKSRSADKSKLAGKTKPAERPAPSKKIAPSGKIVPSEKIKTIQKLKPDEKKISVDSTAEKPSENTAADSREELNPILESGAKEISVPLSAESIRAFSEYARLLKEWNEKMNLTNITDDKGIAIRHFVDSLTLVSHLEDETVRKGTRHLSLIDVGTGAGFPGIPLKVAMPALEVTLLDSLRKRVGFLDAVCTALDLKGITTVHSRAEDAGLSKQYREKYDVATARAVASLPVLCEYCLPFVKIGGIFLAMKGHVEEEAELAQKAIVMLGGTLETLHHFTLPGTDMKRSIIVIRKIRATPAKYPRQAGKPEKEPLI